MSPVFKKLNLKDQRDALVLDAPRSFEPEIAGLEGVAVHRDVDALPEVTFSLAFVKTQEQLDAAIAAVTPKARGDAVVWFAYPKKSSKKYTCEFSRDSGWEALGAAGFEGVRQVAIDQDWSALRFRRAEYIKSMKRDPERALSAQGKKRAAAKPASG